MHAYGHLVICSAHYMTGVALGALQMDDVTGGGAGGGDANAASSTPAFSALSVQQPIPQPVLTPSLKSERSRSAGAGRSAPSSPYALQRTLTPHSGRQPGAWPNHPGLHPLRRVDSAASDGGAFTARSPLLPLRRTASLGELPTAAVAPDEDWGGAREPARGGGPGVLQRLMGRAGSAAGQAGRRRRPRYFGDARRVCSSAD